MNMRITTDTAALASAMILKEYCAARDCDGCIFHNGDGKLCAIDRDAPPSVWLLEKVRINDEDVCSKSHGDRLRKAVEEEMAKYHGKKNDDDHAITQEEIDALLNNSDDEYASVRAFVRMKEMERQQEEKEKGTVQYPQDEEPDEYRYIVATWLDALAAGLTKGARKHPGETWRDIPSFEHAARAMRHLNKYRMGENNEGHLLNASMRCMMAWATKAENHAD